MTSEASAAYTTQMINWLAILQNSGRGCVWRGDQRTGGFFPEDVGHSRSRPVCLDDWLEQAAAGKDERKEIGTLSTIP